MPKLSHARFRRAIGDAAIPCTGDRFELIERFETKPCINADTAYGYSTNIKVAGTNATTALCTHASGGGITLTTAGAAADQTGIIPETASANAWDDTTWPFEDTLEFETEIVTGSTIATALIAVGWKLTIDPDDATDADQVIFQYHAGENGGRWWLIEETTSSQTKTDSASLAVAVSTAYKLAIRTSSDRKPRFYINDSLILASNTALKASLTTVKPVIVVEDVSSGGAAKAVTTRYLKCSKLFS